jgi:A/G-specific adenine glycosylase
MIFESLVNWFLEQARDLPWRVNRTPYAVWVSEVMLQQTQVAVVIPFFQRWMEAFPTVCDLANAPLEAVIKCWEGLGYYSRARNLHLGAKQIVEKHGGVIPNTKEALSEIKGLGPYTVGAILSFAFHQKEPCVDGNVKRVLARYFQIEEDLSKSAVLKKIWNLNESILPDDKPWIVNEALIELGALICTKKPTCAKCPLRSSCKSRMNGMQEKIPFTSKKTSITSLVRSLAVIECEGSYLVRKGKKGEVMHDLYEFPWVEEDQKIEEWLKDHFCNEITFKNTLPEVRHSFTRYRVQLLGAVYQLKKMKEVQDFVWLKREALQEVPFSSGHRRVLNFL